MQVGSWSLKSSISLHSNNKNQILKSIQLIWVSAVSMAINEEEEVGFGQELSSWLPSHFLDEAFSETQVLMFFHCNLSFSVFNQQYNFIFWFLKIIYYLAIRLSSADYYFVWFRNIITRTNTLSFISIGVCLFNHSNNWYINSKFF